MMQFNDMSVKAQDGSLQFNDVQVKQEWDKGTGVSVQLNNMQVDQVACHCQDNDPLDSEQLKH